MHRVCMTRKDRVLETGAARLLAHIVEPRAHDKYLKAFRCNLLPYKISCCRIVDIVKASSTDLQAVHIDLCRSTVGHLLFRTSMSPKKVLLSGSVGGKISVLFKRVAAVNTSNGPFDMLLCTGRFFPEAGE